MKYSPESIVKAWRRYLRGGIGAEKFFNQIEGYVAGKAKRETMKRGFSGSFQAEEAIQRVRERVWDSVKGKRLPEASAKGLHSYLISIISREVWAYHLQDQRPEVGFPPLVMDGIARRAKLTAEDNQFLHELPGVLRERVCKRMLRRFPNIPVTASKFVLDRILNGEYISSSWLERRYKIAKTRFFVESVMISLRIEVCDIKDDVFPIRDTLRETLYGSFVEDNFENYQ